MIGTILSLKYFGRKTWTQSIIFWVVYLIAGAIVSSILAGITSGAVVGGLVVSAAVFILLAHKWYKFPWMESLKLFAIAFVLDIVIVIILVAILFAAIGFTMPDWIPVSNFVNTLI